jgi:hypothetical protein
MTVGEITHQNGKSGMNTTVRTVPRNPRHIAPAMPSGQRAARDARAGGAGAGGAGAGARRPLRDGRLPRGRRPVPERGPARSWRPARPPGLGPDTTLPGAPAPAAGRRAVSRTPFILLVLAMLGGGLVCLLVVNTTLAAASYQISNLQRDNAVATERVQQLQQQVASEESPSSIEQRALQLGMRTQPLLDFVNVKTGRRYTMPSSAPGASAAPGYTP